MQTSEGAGGNIIGTGGRNSTSGGVAQVGGGNTVELSQTGAGNRIRNVEQVGQGPAAGGQRNALAVRQDGIDNTSSASQRGNRNGASDLGGYGAFVTSRSGVTQGVIGQDGLRNSSFLDLDGSRNQFGIAQEGADNEAVVRAAGDANELAIRQDGNLNLGRIRIGQADGDSSRNMAVLNQDSYLSGGNDGRIRIDGSANLVGVDQVGLGAGSVALVDLMGNQNEVDVGQIGSNGADVLVTGNRNLVALGQVGLNTAYISILGNLNGVATAQAGGFGRNDLNASIDGNRNMLNVLQTNTGLFGGATNTIDVSIRGNRNNERSAFTLTPSLTGAAGLAPGTLVQIGRGNSIDMQVGDTDPNSNDNLFAFSQTGDGNGIVGSTNGIGNEVAIVQGGNDNFAAFSQVGNFNSIGVSQ